MPTKRKNEKPKIAHNKIADKLEAKRELDAATLKYYMLTNPEQANEIKENFAIGDEICGTFEMPATSLSGAGTITGYSISNGILGLQDIRVHLKFDLVLCYPLDKLKEAAENAKEANAKS